MCDYFETATSISIIGILEELVRVGLASPNFFNVRFLMCNECLTYIRLCLTAIHSLVSGMLLIDLLSKVVHCQSEIFRLQEHGREVNRLGTALAWTSLI